MTRLLRRVGAGDREAFDRLFPLVYDELERIASRQLRREHGERTLLTQGLVHEAYLRMADQQAPEWQDRAHFFAIAARVMRQVLVDYARRRQAAKRGGDWQQVTLGGADPAFEVALEEVLSLDSALDRLEALEPRLRQVVECRFFAGMEETEIAAALGVSTRTVQRDWVKARAWLHKELHPEGG
ncbi:MAG TPA: sigma-70 family RNA polymerase sigma factor [Thermoanaerobaculia bacterium]